MTKTYGNTCKCLSVLVSVFIFSCTLQAQIRPTDEHGWYHSTSNAIPYPSKRVNLPAGASPGDPNMIYSFVSPANTANGVSVLFVGVPPGSGSIFRDNDDDDGAGPHNAGAITFNYTTGNVVPGADPGATGSGDYRIHFSPNTGSASDTSQKLGNFQLQSIYLAIGTGNTSDISIQGFRAGRMMAQGTITGLSANNAAVITSSITDLSIAGASDQWAGVTVTFGTNWSFIDEIKFTIPSKSIPLSVDDLTFADPATFAPGTQASSANFTATTGITSNIGWTSGSGDYNAVFIAAASSGSPTISDGTDYTANTVFASGSTSGAGWYCIYNGQGSSTTVSGLTPGTAYRVKVVAYNGNTGWGTYNTTEGSGGTANIKNFTTIAIPTTQASNISVTPDYTDFRKATINWTNGDGVKRAVFVKNNTPGQTISSTVPVLHNNNNADALHFTYTAFTDSTGIASSSPARVGTSGWYCVYNNTGVSVSMTRITVVPGQTLRVMVVEYNGTAGAETYNTTSASNNVVDYFNADYPLPVTDPANGITSSGATLNGSIDPRRANITNGTYVYSLSSSLASTLGTITTLTPAATSITGSASATAVAGSITGLSPSTTYYYRLSATSNAGTLTATNSTGGAISGIQSFVTAPVVSAVNATTSNGSYKAGQVIAVTVAFTAAVTVTGTPTITLNSGGAASYASGSGSATLTFNYTVAGGENSADLDYTATSSLSLSGGTIKDAGNNDALLTLPTVGGANSLGGQKNIVIDTQVPTLTATTITSSNATNTLARVGDIITISFTSNEAVLTPAVTIAGGTATVTNAGSNNWTATRAMASGDATGVVSFNISFSDIANNAGTAVTATSNASSVTFDKTTPTLTPVTIVSNNANTALAKVGDLVTLNFTSSETITTPVVTIAGHTAAITNTGGNNWVSAYTMANGDASGVVGFNIAFSDLAGNAGTAVTATTNTSSVIFDKTAPILTPVTIVSNNANTALAKVGDLVTLNFISNETIVTPVVTIAGHTATITNTGGNNWSSAYTMVSSDAAGPVSFNIAFVDVTGNAGTAVASTTNSSNVTFDKTIPLLNTVTIASNNSNTAYAKVGDIITLSLTANEIILSPVITIAGHAVTANNIGGNNWTATYTMISADAPGSVPFAISFNDLSGNAGTAVTATTNSSNITFDKTAPSLTAVTIASNNANTAFAKTGNAVTLNFTSNETIVTPIVTIATNAAAVTNISGNNWRATYTMIAGDAAGTVPFNIIFSDLSGNVGAAVTTTTNTGSVVFDKTAPSLTTVTIASNNANAAIAKPGDIVTINLTANEAIATPIITIAGRTAAITNVSGNNWIAATTMITADAGGNIPFAITVTDLAGNAGLTVTATTNSSNVLFDKTAPSVNTIVRQSPSASQVSVTSVIYRASFSEAVRGISTNAFQLTTGATVAGDITSISVSAGTTVDVTVANIVGNGTMRLDLKNTGTGITDDAGNPISGGFTTGEAYTIVTSSISFTKGASQAITVCQSANAQLSLNTPASINGGNNGQTLTWSVLANPSHGTLSGFPATAVVSSSSTLPSGLAYLPTNGYSGTDVFSIQVSDGFTVIVTTITITINALPAATLTATQGVVLCGTTASLPINASGGATYNWYNNGTLIPNTTTAQVTVNTTGTYTAKAIDAAGCTGAESTGIIVSQQLKPTAAFIFDSYCIDKPVTFTNQSITNNSGTVAYQWSDNNNHTSANASPVFIYTPKGDYTVKLKVTPAACTALADSITKNISIEIPAVAVRIPLKDIPVNAVTPIQARTFGTSYQWLPVGGLSSPNSSSTTVILAKEQEYTVAIKVPSGCITVDTLLVRVQSSQGIFLPNIFTPNNDGQNDKFLPNLVGIRTFYYMRIFNRAGKKIFESTNPAEGWDGKYNGVAQPTGTYVWTASGTTMDGVLINAQGTITIAR